MNLVDNLRKIIFQRPDTLKIDWIVETFYESHQTKVHYLQLELFLFLAITLWGREFHPKKWWGKNKNIS